MKNCISSLNEELQKIANEELGEVTSRIPEDLATLRLWLQHQPHLKYRDDDQFLLQFLRGCKYSMEKAKTKLDLFYSLKSKYPEMLNLCNVDDPKFREVCKLGTFLTLPNPVNGTGPRIVVGRYCYPTNKFGVEDIFQPACALHEILLAQDPFACICGIIYIVDFKEATASHFLQMTPNFCMKLVSFLEKSMPLRIKSVYYINTSGAAQQFFKILFPFFSQKLRERVHVMGADLSEMIKDLSIECLPKDYGGNLPSLEDLTVEFNKSWESCREFFKENANCGTDETLRPGKPLDIDGLFGVGGSFRQLIVD
ncbi:alpha-tocopherol transfer protein-like [Musca vetustissima]|uniref:alpha-tocopherol transfer protein-like n=1 Tax=Musca vetustissima TaxID=27455 RepID=UPI002AB67112|nr:alpha-tocopherol transfer protein-like [Musca vetustissima]